MKQIVEFINKYETFIIVGHKEPDFDCIGSQLALSSFLKRLNKNTILLNKGPFNRKEIKKFKVNFSDDFSIINTIQGSACIIVVDSSTLERTGIKFELQKLPIAKIDHHSSGEIFTDVELIDPNAPSTTFLIEKLIRKFYLKPSKEEAWLLLGGFCTDTGFFKYLDKYDSEPFEMVSRCVSMGNSLKDLYSYINSGRSFTSLKMLEKYLIRLESFENNLILVSHLYYSDYKDLDLEETANDVLYSLLSNTENNEIIVVLKEKEDGSIVCGLRSNKYFDVGELAQAFGGGGHKNASGFLINGKPLEIIKKEILVKIKQML